MSSRKLIGVLAVLAVFAWLLFSWKAAAQDLPTVKIAYHRSSLVGITYPWVAKEYGLDKKHGINLELVPFNAPPDVVRAVIQGQVDAAAGSGLVPILGAAENFPMRFFAIYYDSIEEPEFFVVRRQGTGIQKLSDIIVRPHTVIAYNPPSPSTEHVVKKVLGKLGADMSRLTLVSAGPGDAVRLFKSGEADLLIAINPAATIAARLGGGEVIETATMARYIENPHTDAAAFAPREFAVKNPKLFGALSRVYAEAIEIVRRDPEKARAVLARKAPPEWNLLAPYVVFAGAWGEKEIDKNALQRSFDALWEEKMTRKRFLAEDFLGN